MNQKERRLSAGLSLFLFLCAAINFAGGQVGAAVCSLGAGVFFSALSSADSEETGNGRES